MIVITYWHDSDDETITSVACNTEDDAVKIQQILEKYGMDIISVDELKPSTPDEIEQMCKDFYSETTN